MWGPFACFVALPYGSLLYLIPFRQIRLYVNRAGSESIGLRSGSHEYGNTGHWVDPINERPITHRCYRTRMLMPIHVTPQCLVETLVVYPVASLFDLSTPSRATGQSAFDPPEIDALAKVRVEAETAYPGAAF